MCIRDRANLFGVPLGTLVSHLLSWRALFCIAGVWGAVTAFFLWRWVPWMEPVADSRGLKGQFAFLRNRAPWLIIPVSYTHLDVYKRQAYSS